ncbi:hypothetical protein IHE61_15010 [Streptomyces sp. GKU 257-1]|nr:hypothetical protein [Streptomyces sp. GKU 257-1]
MRNWNRRRFISTAGGAAGAALLAGAAPAAAAPAQQADSAEPLRIVTGEETSSREHGSPGGDRLPGDRHQLPDRVPRTGPAA